MPILVSAVVVSRDKKELLSRAIDSLIGQSMRRGDYEIIIVDDGSAKDGLSQLVAQKKKKFQNIRLVRQVPGGLSAGRNNGAKNARGKIVAFTDNDCIADREWLKSIAEKFAGRGVVGVEGKIIPSLPGVPDSPRGLFTNAPENLSGGRFTGCNSAYLRGIIAEKAAGYDERMNFWREDSEFAFRAMEFGRIVFAPDAVIYHPMRRDPPLTIFRYLFFLRNEWVCFLRHPEKYLRYIGLGVPKGLLKSAVAWAFFSWAIFGIWSGFYSISAFSVFAKLLLDTIAGYLLVISGKLSAPATFWQAIAYSLLNWAKDIAYPVFLAWGFFDAVLFMVLGGLKKTFPANPAGGYS